jgi:1-acyl-sn-glycerol-3-phosphate acyltransferase
MFSLLLGFLRFVVFAIYVSFFSVIYFIVSLFLSKETNSRNALVLRDFLIQTANRLLGIRIIVYGEKPAVQGLIVANHRSYFDPIAIVNQVHAFPVGKKEVESWPLIGYLCKISGVLFVNRSCKKSRQDTAENILEVLSKGYSIINFPEGTTHTLPTTAHFNHGSFVMATKIKAAVIPVAIDYKVITDAFVGDDTFVPHFLKCFGKWTTEIKMTFFPPIYSEDSDFLLNTSKDLIDKELLRYRKDWDNEK